MACRVFNFIPYPLCFLFHPYSLLYIHASSPLQVHRREPPKVMTRYSLNVPAACGLMNHLPWLVSGLALAALFLGPPRAAAQPASLGTTRRVEGPAAGVDSVLLALSHLTN